MFRQMEQAYVDPSKHSVVQLYQSLNQPQISPEPNVAPEASTSVFIVTEEGEEQLRLFIGLSFSPSEHRILYCSEAFLPEDSPEVLAQAEAFAGEMGFMMDDLRYGSATDRDREDMLRRIPFFYANQETYLQALSESEREAKLNHTQMTATKESAAEKYNFFLQQYVTILSML